MKEAIQLKSGRVLEPNCGILGLEWYEGRWRVTEGYDNIAAYDSGWHGYDDIMLTSDERREVALRMIERWREWGEVEDGVYDLPGI